MHHGKKIGKVYAPSSPMNMYIYIAVSEIGSKHQYINRNVHVCMVVSVCFIVESDERWKNSGYTVFDSFSTNPMPCTVLPTIMPFRSSLYQGEHET